MLPTTVVALFAALAAAAPASDSLEKRRVQGELVVREGAAPAAPGALLVAPAAHAGESAAPAAEPAKPVEQAEPAEDIELTEEPTPTEQVKRAEQAKAGDAAKTSDAAKSDDAAKAGDAVKTGDAAKTSDAAKSGDAAKTGDAAKSGDAAKTGDAAKAGDAAKTGDAAKAGKVRGCEDLKTNGPVVEHKVVQGDTLSKLTATFQSGICNIAKESKIADPDKIDVGQVLKIPSGLCTQNVDNFTCIKAAAANPNTDEKGTCLKKGPFTRVIKQGDSFIGIAKELGLQEKAVLDANPGVDRFNLQPGQTINLPQCKT
ncbi:uncharacterized protein PpBr36_06606 [Pyricularia pennisetigena]|uniref:uncharacterized protein n=1 Tax=Pyricularia pennisetigena TaxID=1578925 RepID=UPI00114ED93C|nr:uncharacterized protein PpBr36_06606 [Pyricularia pennisetigena]TLS23689.1 hypothetical protein PpBr36_06606 [Pyricularia pennisetigena]